MVSVVMPNYNGGKFISDSIKSVLNQTFSNIELIIVDDNSTDDSLEIIKTFNDKRIKLINLSVNKGVSNARNVGINQSKGKFISFIDSDDYWIESKLETQLKFMSQNNLNLTYSSVNIIDQKNNFLKIFKTKAIFSSFELMKFNYIPTVSLTFEKEIIGNTKFQLIKHEDYLFILELSKNPKTRGRGYLSPLVNYRIHNNSLTKNKIKSFLWHLNILFRLEKNPLRLIYYISCYLYNGIKKYT
jgi:glycosyltransferase involved in cell wall biosynthesis